MLVYSVECCARGTVIAMHRRMVPLCRGRLVMLPLVAAVALLGALGGAAAVGEHVSGSSTSIQIRVQRRGAAFVAQGLLAPSSRTGGSRLSARFSIPRMPLAQGKKGRAVAGAVRMGGAGQEDGLRIVNFGKTKELKEKEEAAQLADGKQIPNQAVLEALSLSSWWKHDPKHRTKVDGEDIVVDYDQVSHAPHLSVTRCLHKSRVHYVLDVDKGLVNTSMYTPCTPQCTPP